MGRFQGLFDAVPYFSLCVKNGRRSCYVFRPIPLFPSFSVILTKDLEKQHVKRHVMEMTGEMYTFFFDRKPINVREGHVNRQNGKHEFFFLMATIFLREKMQIELQISDILDEFLVVATETVEETTP